MLAQTPQEVMRQLIAAFNAGDVDAALALYHPEATVVFERGRPATGLAAIREVMEKFLGSQPRLAIEAHATIESDDVALHCTRWSLTRIGANDVPEHSTGRGAVVLRRRDDGSWAVAIENPWVELVG
jgi:uncharacterized protein (TIGR02246 family)